MANFTYIARDRVGKRMTGVISAKDAAEAREELRNKELFVTNIREQAERTATAQPGSLFTRKKVKLGDMVVMSRQLATLVRAGLSIVECLYAVAAQTENLTLAAALQKVRLDVMTGSTLTEAMRKHPKIFSEKYISLVQAGETGGVLEMTLEVAADQFDKEATLREKVKSAFVYPIIVLVASVGVVIFMLLFIVPVFADVYKQFKATLPPVTLLLVTVSDVTLHYWWMVLTLIIVSALGIRKYIQTPSGKRIFDKLMLKLPLLGKLNRKIAISRFTQTFSGSVKAGVPILQALMISAQTSANTVILDAVQKVTNQVKEGATLSGPLEGTGEFPPMVTRMVAAGEQSGNLDEMLEEVTKFYERDIEYTVERLTRVTNRTIPPTTTVIAGSITRVSR